MTRKTLFALIAVIALALAVAVPPLTAGPGARNVVTAMSGAEEVPATGDPDGYGSTAIEVTATNQICYRLLARKVSGVTMGHIHRGAPGVKGGIVVTLFTGSVPSGPRTCRQTTAALAKEILAFPGRFYVNVHTTAHPDGAIRGQLVK
jgi:hypothetical protein